MTSMPESGGARSSGSLADRVDLIARTPWKIVPRETMEDGTKYPACVVAGELEYTVCYLESPFVADKFPETDFTTKPHAQAIAAIPLMLDALRTVATIPSLSKLAREKVEAALSAVTVPAALAGGRCRDGR